MSIDGFQRYVKPMPPSTPLTAALLPSSSPSVCCMLAPISTASSENRSPIFSVSFGRASAAPSVGALTISDGRFAVFFARFVALPIW